MKKVYNIILLLTINVFCFSCDEEELTNTTTSSLKVVHAVPDAPSVHVNYFGRDITFLNNPVLSFGTNGRYTLPAGTEREIKIINSEDTLSQILTTSVLLPAGGMGTLFLTGQSENIEALFLEDDILSITDSLVGVRFVNLSPDIGSISVGVAGEETNIINGLNYKDASAYNELIATSSTGVYSFEFKDSNENIVATTFLNPIPPFGTKPLFKNMTFALIGLADNGNGSSSVSVRTINNF